MGHLNTDRSLIGEKIGAFALTEPGAGSDAVGVQTTAVRDGHEYILNGNKIWTLRSPKNTNCYGV
jgi:alkylation response protein AidB-like acyl-CoA dehydrogenase